MDMIKQHIRLNNVETWVTVLNLSRYMSVNHINWSLERHTDLMSVYADCRRSTANYDDRHTTFQNHHATSQTRDIDIKRWRTHSKADHADGLEHA